MSGPPAGRWTVVIWLVVVAAVLAAVYVGLSSIV